MRLGGAAAGLAGFAGRWGGAPAGGLPVVAAFCWGTLAGWGVFAGVVPGARLLAAAGAVAWPAAGGFPEGRGFAVPDGSLPALSPLNAWMRLIRLSN
ncbi:hypothetical protein RBSWK_06509 [Rhodopirellula baltica SWK14]|uniref:Uncharacterized protein n=1 Tax=Rhodopirellula baltica SWK14 TaxID=993516 RepID=L7C6K2_RHOBT|nr:hypothetical protein RBSWK_06509 [Rhodopirellula baltica SWK14]